MFANGVGYYLLEKCKINESRNTSQLTETEIQLLAKAIKNLCEVLPSSLSDNLQKAYDVFLKSAEEENEELDTILEECDNFFYDNEQLILDILKDYANTLEVI